MNQLASAKRALLPELNKKIHRKLREAKISQRELAEYLCISAPSVNERINKDRPIDSISFIKAVSHLTQTPLSFFIEPFEEPLKLSPANLFYKTHCVSTTELVFFMVKKNKIKNKDIMRELGLNHSVISWRLSCKKEIDSLKFVRVISKLTSLPISFYIQDTNSSISLFG